MDLYKFLRVLPFKRFKEPPRRVTVLRLAGVIGGVGGLREGLSLSALDELLKKAFAVSHLSAVALEINSPGGSPVQSALIASRIRQLAAEKEVQVLAFCEDVAASGGYWLACAGDEITVEESSIVGSIGVISASFGLTGLIEKIGVERRLYTAGDKKSLLDPFLPTDPKDVKRLETVQKEIHASFKNWVKERRGEKLAGSDKLLFSGEFWTGAKAKELGLADRIGSLHETLRERFGKDVKIIPIKQRGGFLKRRLGLELPGAARPRAARNLSPADELGRRSPRHGRGAQLLEPLRALGTTARLYPQPPLADRLTINPLYGWRFEATGGWFHGDLAALSRFHLGRRIPGRDPAAGLDPEGLSPRARSTATSAARPRPP